MPESTRRRPQIKPVPKIPPLQAGEDPNKPEGITRRFLAELAATVESLREAMRSTYASKPAPHASTHDQTGTDPLTLPGTPTNVDSVTPAAVGSGPAYALEDHRHGLDWQLQGPSTTSASPNYSFQDEPTSGMYWDSNYSMALALLGSMGMAMYDEPSSGVYLPGWPYGNHILAVTSHEANTTIRTQEIRFFDVGYGHSRMNSIVSTPASGAAGTNSLVFLVSKDRSSSPYQVNPLTLKGSGEARIPYPEWIDTTTGDVDASTHGLVPKAPNDATKYLDGTGAWSTPAGSGGGGGGDFHPFLLIGA